MNIATPELMRTIDKLSIEEFKIPGIVLMENAAICVVNVILAHIKNTENDKIIIVAGKGNNGGDGFAIARHLYQKNIDVSVIFVGDINAVMGDALINLNIIKALKVPIFKIKSEKEIIIVKKIILQADIIVDAILGTGLTGEPKGLIKQVINTINENSHYTIAVDVPSGVNADTGQTSIAVKANITVTFALIKQGLLLYPSIEYVGELIVADIGIPKQAIESMNIKTNVLEETDINILIPKRNPRSNKGTYGKLLVIGGSKEMTGAVVLTCKAAYKMGVGLVNLAAIEEVINVSQCNIIENINTILPSEYGKVCFESFEAIKDIVKNVDAVAVGMGLGIGKQVTKFIGELLYNITVPVVIDADGLNAVANDINILKSVKAPVIITPHPGEMSRLTDISIEDILNNTIEIAKEFSAEYNVITLLKDCKTIITNPQKEIYINTTGNASMAKAGSGDVLTGIIGSLLAQGTNPFMSATLGAYIHGRAGERASHELGMYGVMASNLCDFI